jgi:hypothetical protein
LRVRAAATAAAAAAAALPDYPAGFANEQADEGVGLDELRLDLGGGGEAKGDAVDLGQLERALARDGIAVWFRGDIDEVRRR